MTKILEKIFSIFHFKQHKIQKQEESIENYLCNRNNAIKLHEYVESLISQDKIYIEDIYLVNFSLYKSRMVEVLLILLKEKFTLKGIEKFDIPSSMKSSLSDNVLEVVLSHIIDSNFGSIYQKYMNIISDNIASAYSIENKYIEYNKEFGQEDLSSDPELHPKEKSAIVIEEDRFINSIADLESTGTIEDIE